MDIEDKQGAQLTMRKTQSEEPFDYLFCYGETISKNMWRITIFWCQ